MSIKNVTKRLPWLAAVWHAVRQLRYWIAPLRVYETTQLGSRCREFTIRKFDHVLKVLLPEKLGMVVGNIEVFYDGLCRGRVVIDGIEQKRVVSVAVSPITVDTVPKVSVTYVPDLSR